MPRKAKNYDELELKDDFMFGMVMRNPKYVKPFLEAILKIKIRKVVYPESQKAIDLSANAKGVRLDVYVEDDQNTVFNLEMQTTHKKDLPKRMRYYQGMIDLNILNKGESYCNLKKSYVIFICTFDPFGEGRHIYTFCNTCQENTSLTLNDDAVKIVLNTKGTIDDVSPEMKRILDYIEGKGASDTFTRELENAVQSVRQNEDWRRDYMTLQQEYQERFQEGKEEGWLEGRREGKIEGKIELLAHDFHLTVPEIAEKLLLSEDEVQRILDHLQ
ncbi:MAG: Rpn family recombination-promoting nuclease/putative transposase [Clostridium sp.]